MRPALYIPHHRGVELLERTLRSLGEQTRPLDVVVVDNGSSDGSAELVRSRFPEVELLELGENLGFGAALNMAIERRPSDPVVLLNNDVQCDPRFNEALLDAYASGIECVAGVLAQESAPGLIDSAGVTADRTLMGFDYLHGEPLAAAEGAADPLGPSGGAALYRLDAFEAVGGFDERIFLYYEDLDLALRLRARGAGCRLAAGAVASHAYSAGLGAGSGDKYAQTGWSRAYMLRRYGVMGHPSRALRACAAEAAICAGQLLRDRTGKGVAGRLRGWRAAAGLERLHADEQGLLDVSLREALGLRFRRRG